MIQDSRQCHFFPCGNTTVIYHDTTRLFKIIHNTFYFENGK